MSPVSRSIDAARGGAARVRGDGSCPPVTAPRLAHRSARRVLWSVSLLVLFLCLALPNAGWAAMPSGEPPVGSQGAPHAVQDVTWSLFTPAGWVAALPFTSTVTATSPAGLGSGDAYSVSTNGGATWSAWSTVGLSTSIPGATTHNITVTGLTFPDSAAQNLIRFRAFEAGSEIVSPSYTVRVDTTAPDPPANLAGSPARQWTNVNSFSESWQNPADVSGIVGAYYKLNWPPIHSTDGTLIATSNTISNIVVPGDGQHDIYLWLLDAAGNVNSASRNADPDVFWYDGTLPVSTAIPTTAPGAMGWYTTSVTINFAATDSPEDPNFPPLVYTSLNGGVWKPLTQLELATEGSQTLRYQARDKAGNEEAIKRSDFNIDLTPPAVSLAAGRSPTASGWYTASVPYTLTVSDLVSGVRGGYYRLDGGPWTAGNSFTLAADGNYLIEAYGEDVAGNRSATVTQQAHVDATKPVTAREIDGTLGENGWYVSDLTVRLLPTDNLSGVAQTNHRINETDWKTGVQFLMADDGIWNESHYSVDTAGNTELVVTQQVKIDTTAPGAPTAMQAVPAGWTRTNSFDVTWTPPAGDLSGVAGVYYKLGGAPTAPGDGAYVLGATRLDDLAVPAEGAYRLYLWSRDKAGNVDHTTAPADGPILRYDVTPPATSVLVDGNVGSNGWYRSPVNVTLSAADGASGVSALRYRVYRAGEAPPEWQLTSGASVVLAFSEVGEHVVEFYAQDVAGNVEAARGRAVNLDFTAPPAPPQVKVLPGGWTSSNSFRIEWLPVEDLSGIAGAYVRFGSPPSHSTDGTFYEGTIAAQDVKAPDEGRHTAYVWLADVAGNADDLTAVVIEDAMWYDGIPPATVVTPTVASGLNGWYVEPVTFAMSATDATSGVREIRSNVDGGAWTAGETFAYGEDGRHTIRISAVDNAGNEEPAHIFEVDIDRTPPQAAFTVASGSQSQASFTVTWYGSDGANGSGVASYDVFSRDGYNGVWRELLEATQLTALQFDGQRGHTYFFQVFARDHAGNRQPAPGVWRVLIQPVLNGGFDTGVLPPDWTTSGSLPAAVVWTTGPDNQRTSAAQLSNDGYGPNFEPPGNIPTDSATIRQTITIPEQSQVREACLGFWYRVLTYDVMYSQNFKEYIDTFDVTLSTVGGQEIALLLRDGNPINSYEWWDLYKGSPPLYDTGWKAALIDLKAYAGQTLQLAFANWNRRDNQYNTWSYVDRIRIGECNRAFAPLIQAGYGSVWAAGEPAQPAGPSAVDRGDAIR